MTDVVVSNSYYPLEYFKTKFILIEAITLVQVVEVFPEAPILILLVIKLLQSPFVQKEYVPLYGSLIFSQF